MAHADVAGGLPSAQVTATGGWVCFEDEAGAWLNGPIRRTWGKAGQTPVPRLSGKRNDKISMVAWICFKEGAEPRMIYAVKPSGGHTKKGFPRFLAPLHRRLDSPVTLIWDNYSSHISKHVKHVRATEGLAHHSPAALVRPRAEPRRTPLGARQGEDREPGVPFD